MRRPGSLACRIRRYATLSSATTRTASTVFTTGRSRAARASSTGPARPSCRRRSLMPETSTVTMQIFLNEFAKTIAPDEHVALVLDQAGWHGAKALTVPDSMTLVALPPYSPELNPVERVWLYLKERFLSHRLLDAYDAIVGATCAAWNRLRTEVGRITSLCSYPWIEAVNS